MKIFSNSSARTAAGRLALTAALAAMPILTACGGQTHQKGPAAQTIQVHLTEGSIQIPASVPAVEPGKTASLQINLDPGTYRVLSPVDAEKNQGMAKALSVTQS